jgi:hypothetical protein
MVGLASERVERRLTAILAVDVAGYSRLMGAEEEGTLARLKAHRRELVDPKIADHRGHIVKTTGTRPWLIDAKQIVEAEVFSDDDDQVLDWRRRGKRCLGCRRSGERDKRRRGEQYGPCRRIPPQPSSRARYCATKSQPTISL